MRFATVYMQRCWWALDEAHAGMVSMFVAIGEDSTVILTNNTVRGTTAGAIVQEKHSVISFPATPGTCPHGHASLHAPSDRS